MHPSHRKPRLLPLAACVIGLFGVTAAGVCATTHYVQNCNDSGTGSLRSIIDDTANTMSGDAVDLSQLGTCGSSISLTTGAITVTQNNLTIQGPAGSHATVTGYYYATRSSELFRVLTHTGTGTLTLAYLNISYGNPVSGSSLSGGCIFSAGNVFLEHVQVYACKATSTVGGKVYGAGVYSAGNLTAKYSRIFDNKIATAGTSFGAGAFAQGKVTMNSSTISGNSGAERAAGVAASHGASITGSTISGNTSNFDMAGLYVVGTGADSLLISNSTISGNYAVSGTVGGVFSRISTTVQNSTIAFNSANSGNLFNPPQYFSPGLSIAPAGAITVTLQSSIISNNTYGTGNSVTEADFSTDVVGPNSVTLGGSGNLIRVAKGPQTPVTTTSCPMLGALRSNGGPTQTHALMSRSPAIDAGNNNANLSTDQRGPGYFRVSGPPGSADPGADIGSYEVQQDDVIFTANSETCPALF